jgi:hypothetical protein
MNSPSKYDIGIPSPAVAQAEIVRELGLVGIPPDAIRFSDIRGGISMHVRISDRELTLINLGGQNVGAIIGQVNGMSRWHVEMRVHGSGYCRGRGWFGFRLLGHEKFQAWKLLRARSPMTYATLVKRLDAIKCLLKD